jgi:integrase
MPTITMLPEAQPRQGFVEEADFRAIVKHLEPGPALAATIAFETAWRIRSEVLTLECSRVDLAEGCIRLDGAHSKNGQPRTAYLSPATTKLLAEQRARVQPSTANLVGSFPTCSSTPKKAGSGASDCGSLSRRGGRPVARPVILAPCSMI